MAMKMKRPHRDFWNSNHVKNLIRAGLGNKTREPGNGLEVWEALQQEIRSLNSRGRIDTASLVSLVQKK
jgi:hypothetical protein